MSLRRFASYAVAFLTGLGAGMALTAWLVSASAHAGAPKYRLALAGIGLALLIGAKAWR